MAKPKDLESIKLLADCEEGRRNISAETKTSGADSVNEAKDTQAEANTPGCEGVTEAQKEPREKKRRKRNTNKTGDVKGISPKSPIVRLLEDEKRFIKRLEAHILLETGETISDHQLIMDAVREYVKKHYSDFQ